MLKGTRGCNETHEQGSDVDKQPSETLSSSSFASSSLMVGNFLFVHLVLHLAVVILQAISPLLCTAFSRTYSSEREGEGETRDE